MILHLIQSQEAYGSPERMAELQTAWAKNEQVFDRITRVEGRPTFTVLFEMCHPDAVNVIANCDIYFDETLCEHAHRLGTAEVWALSRWDDMGGDNLYPYHRRDSQDAWIVRGAPTFMDLPYQMGVPGVDNCLIHTLRHDYGFTVTNPCQSVRAIHLHRSGYRTYGEGRGKPKTYRYPPPYAFAEPCSL